jgi:metal-sulfur cluster biosynthetic enzyme
MLTEAQILLALRDCYDPEVPLNVLELGLAESINLTMDRDAPGAGIPGVPDRYSVVVKLLRGGRDEAVDVQLAALVYNRLTGLQELSRIVVDFADGPVWTPARITAAGRRTLGLDQPLFPILNNRMR